MLPELITFVQFSWWRPPKSMISKNPSERKDEPNLPETVPTFDFSSEIQPTKQIKLMTMQDPIEKNIGKYHIATDCSRNISSLVKRIRNWRSIKVEIAKSNSTLSTKNQQPPPPPQIRDYPQSPQYLLQKRGRIIPVYFSRAKNKTLTQNCYAYHWIQIEENCRPGGERESVIRDITYLYEDCWIAGEREEVAMAMYLDSGERDWLL